MTTTDKLVFTNQLKHLQSSDVAKLGLLVIVRKILIKHWLNIRNML